MSTSPDGTHVFYRSVDNFIHQQYYNSQGQWRHDWMICNNDLNSQLLADIQISSTNNIVYYAGADQKVHIWEFDGDCN